MFSADSELVDVVRPGLGFRRGKLRDRHTEVKAVVIHTTGGGVIRRYEREGQRKGDLDTFHTTLRIYATIMESSGHYVIGQQGQIGQTVPEDVIAHHVGSGKAAHYFRSGDWRPRWQRDRYAWWGKRWQGLTNPRDLAGGELWAPYAAKGAPRAWRRGAPNPHTIGIEVVPPMDSASGPWSTSCWDALARLCVDIQGRHGIPFERDRWITHSDAHPLSRTSKRGTPWDTSPAQFDWDDFAEECSRIRRERKAC